MDSDGTPEPEKTESPLKKRLTPFKNLLTPLKKLLTPLKKLPIPKKLAIPAIVGAVILIAGGAALGLFHARLKHAASPQVKAVASAPVASTIVPAKAEPAKAEPAKAEPAKAVSFAACGGVVRDLYRQTSAEDPSVTLAEVRSEVLSSGVNCAPVPEIAAELKDLSPACRDMVQYTFLGVRDGNADITVNDIREKVVEKSVACEHDRRPALASVARHKAK